MSTTVNLLDGSSILITHDDLERPTILQLKAEILTHFGHAVATQSLMQAGMEHELPDTHTLTGHSLVLLIRTPPAMTYQARGVLLSGSTHKPPRPSFPKDREEIHVVVLGGKGVGKTAMTIRQVTDNFVEEYDDKEFYGESYRKHCLIDDQAALLDIVEPLNEDYAANWHDIMQDQVIRGRLACAVDLNMCAW